MPTRVLGLLDLSAASSADDERPVDVGTAIAQAETMIEEGADMVVVAVAGASVAEQHLESLVAALAARLPVGVRTARAELARAGLTAGATLLDDPGGSLGSVAAELGAGWIAGVPDGHRDDPAAPGTEPTSGSVEIWLDPGFGRGRELDDDLALLARLDQLIGGPYPLALSTGGPSFPDQPASSATVAAVTLALLLGVGMVRTHDVKAIRQAATVAAGHAALRSR